MLYNLVRLLPNPLISILKDQIYCHHIFIFYLSFFSPLNLSLLFIWLSFIKFLRIMSFYMPFMIYVSYFFFWWLMRRYNYFRGLIASLSHVHFSSIFGVELPEALGLQKSFAVCEVCVDLTHIWSSLSGSLASFH